HDHGAGDLREARALRHARHDLPNHQLHARGCEARHRGRRQGGEGRQIDDFRRGRDLRRRVGRADRPVDLELRAAARRRRRLQPRGRAMTGPLLAFLGISALVIMTPGPDTALTVRTSLLGGGRGGAFTALGVVCGQALWVLASSLGAVALLAASEPVFEVIKWVGSAYLVWLGLVSLVDAWRDRLARATADVAASAARLSSHAAFRQGILSDLGNPKMAVFFTSPAAAVRGRLRHA